MLKGNKCSTLYTVIMMIAVLNLIGCTDVVPQVSILRSQLDGSSKIVFNQFIPGQNPANDYSEKSVSVSGNGYSSYKITAISSMLSCNNVDFSMVPESPPGKVSLTPQKDGAFVFCAIGKVATTGKWQEASQAVSSAILEVDTLPPENNSFSINSQAAYTKVPGVQLQLASTGAKEMYITQNETCNTDGDWEPFATTKTLNLKSTNSINHVYVKFRDAALNESSCLTQQIVHDDIAPSKVLVISPADGSVFNASTSNPLAFTINCDVTSSEIQVSGAATLSIPCDPDAHAQLSLALSNLPEGQISLQFKALDLAGNESPITVVNYLKDTVPPGVGKFTQPGPGSYANISNYKNFAVAGTCDVGAVVLFNSQEFPCTTGSWQTTTDLTAFPDGSYTISFTQRDGAGNVGGPASFTFFKDTVAPSIPTISAPSYVSQANQMAFPISGSCETGNTVRLKTPVSTIDIPCSSNSFNQAFDFSGLLEGNLGVEALQIDPAGNSSSTIVTSAIKDTVAPTVTLSGLPESPSGADPLSVSVAGPADLISYKYKVGLQASTDCAVTSGYNSINPKGTLITTAMSGFADGTMILCVLGVDAAGNIQSTATSTSWIKDTTMAYLKIVERERTLNTGSGAQQFTLQLSQAKLYPVQVTLKTQGDAVYSTDHSLSDSTAVTVAAGAISASVPFTIFNNTGTAPGYSTLKVKISNISMPLVSADNLSQSTVFIKYAGTLPTASMVSVGGQHTCAILSSGKLKCWGDNTYGQLGIGSTIQNSTPSAVDANSNYSYVSAGNSHTCAIKSSQLLCWGSNSSNELGTAGGNVSVPTITDSGTNYSQVSAGSSSTCGVTTAGVLRCWGVNANYRLGYSTLGVLLPTNIGSGYNFVSLGLNHACGLLTDGTLNCWGDNTNGQMGDGTINSRQYPAVTDNGTKYNTVSVGETHTCGITTGGILKCWGANNSGQLGQGDTTTRYTPTTVSTGGFLKVWAGTGHTCALSSANLMYCWGLNSEGQLLIGSGASVYSVSSVDVSTTFTTGSARYNTTCGITSDGNLKCGGSNTSGQVGDSTIMNKRTPASTGLSNVAKIAVGYGHSCSLIANRILCSGLNSNGQVGDGTTVNRLTATKIDPAIAYTHLTANYYHSCGITDEAQLKCWGKNDSGQIGDGTTANKLVPTLIDSSVAYSAVSPGTFHTCAITNGGVLKCWGKNNYGQLGNNSTTNASTPQIIDPGVSYLRVSAHDSHTCAITTGGVLKCWGDQSYGKQGDGYTSGSKYIPTVVDSGVAYSYVTTGYDSTCAITSGGVLKCFGFNSYGQIGNGTTTNATSPTVIDSGVSYARVAMGHYHTCGVTTTGILKCWGYNDSAQVGNNSIVYQMTPQVIDSGVAYSEIALGYNSSCALTTTSDTKCWGSNNYGQYGDGGIPSHWHIPLNIMKWLVP